MNTFVQPAKEGENDTAPHKIACLELSGNNRLTAFNHLFYLLEECLNIFQLVKSQITTRQAAEHYG
ncbi:MAG: hypothetical protein ACLR4A_13980, partial [Christensenellales bacterium]